MKGLGLNKLLGNIKYTFSRQVVTGMFQLIIAVIIARVYGPEGNGSFVMSLLLSNMLISFLNIGITSANVYYIGSGKVSVNTAWHALKKLFFIILLIGLSIGFIVVLYFSDKLFFGVKKELLWIALILFPVSLLLSFVSSMLQGLQEFKSFNLMFLLQPIINLLLISIVAMSGNKNLVWLISAYIISTSITLCIGVFFLQKKLKENQDCEIKSGYIKLAINYGYKAHLSNLLAFVNYKADIILVNYFLGAASTGIYVIAVQLAGKLWLLSQSVSTVLLPRLSELESNEKKRKKTTPIISRWVIFLTLLGAIILSIFIYPLIKLIFGEDYLDAVIPFLFLLPGVVATSGARILANDLAARGRPELNLYTALITVGINISSNLILIPKYGLIGAAISTSLCFISNLILKLIVYWKICGITWEQVIFIRLSDIAELKLFLKRKQ